MDAKEEIKQRLSIEEVVSDYLELRRAGRNFKALSPFSHEKTPSFMVSPEKQIWHDFSSQKGGDIFSFIMEVEAVDFRGALEILARKANVDLSQFQNTQNGQRAKIKQRLIAAHTAATQFYHLSLSRNPAALTYIKAERGFTVDTIRTWQLGYSPEDGRTLYAYLTKRGFTDGELSQAGLITKRRGQYGDMFRGRIMVPLSDGQGQVVGFTARLLKDDPQAPKYFNTPQTLIYDKGRQVFGLHHAKEAIRKSDKAVLVEGNFDVISSHQAGIKNVVAAAGTALTADHIRSLSRITPHILLAFDADQAGLNATERSISLAQSVNVDLRVVPLPEGVKDPDELIGSDIERWQSCIQQAVDAPTWILSRYESMYDKTTAEGKRQLSTKALAVVGGLHDAVEQEHHLKSLAKYLDVSVASLTAKMKGRSSAKTKQLKETHIQPGASSTETAYEDDFLALNLFFPEVRDSLKDLESTVFTLPQRSELFDALKKLSPHQRFEVEHANRLNLDEDSVKILLFTAEEKYASWTPADIMAETMALARRILKHSQQYKKNKLTNAIREAEVRGDHEGAAQLLDQYQQLLKGD